MPPRADRGRLYFSDMNRPTQMDFRRLALLAACLFIAFPFAAHSQTRAEMSLDGVTPRATPSRPAAVEPAGPAARDTQAPRVQAGHVLYVNVMVKGKSEISESQKRVSEGGFLSLPLIGLVDVEDFTISQMTRVLQKKYAVYLKDPLVDCGFVVDNSPDAVSPWGSVTVLGKVRTPGRVNIPPTQDLTLSMAIQLAGGYDESAKDTQVKITRPRPGGSNKVMTIDMRALAAEGRTENDVALKDGDVIFVPTKVF